MVHFFFQDLDPLVGVWGWLRWCGRRGLTIKRLL
jgi:hypothetical protein